VPSVKMVPIHAPRESIGARYSLENATFGQRRATGDKPKAQSNSTMHTSEGGLEMSWVPSGSHEDDSLYSKRMNKGKVRGRNGVERFGAGMEKGSDKSFNEMNESDRKGRTQRRKGVRSGSKSAFRRMGL
jgi:ribosome biogenesis protein ENP2